MKIKRYEGRSETEVMTKIKEDLGPDALILNVKRTDPVGIMKFFKSPVVEITATNDELYTRPVKKKKKEEFFDEDQKEEIDKIKAKKEKDESIKNLESKMENIESLLKVVSEKIENTANSSEKSESKFNNNILQLFYDNMIKNEVLPEVAADVLNGLDNVSEKNNVNEMVKIVYNRITEKLGKPQEVIIDKDAKKPKIVAFVGPTGVGKTTTIAKIIAKFILDNKKKVALVTADTYRIAAVEQLKTYAQILGAPIDVVYNPEELKEKIEKHSDKELLFLDTAGRSHKNKEQFDELTKLLNTIDNKEVFLVLSLATKYKDMVEIINKYSEIIESYKIIFTKMDETMGLGNILNIKVLTSKPCSYLTFGQDVPEDIEVMNPEKVAKYLLGSFDK